jgi:hypothetical protein
MRVIVTCMMALGLVAMPVMAGTGRPGDETSNAAKSTDAAAKKANDAAPDKAKPADATPAKSKTDSSAKPDSTSMENELQQLRELIEAQSRQLQAQSEQLKAQQEKMAALESKMNSANAAAPASSNSGPSSSLGSSIAASVPGGATTVAVSNIPANAATASTTASAQDRGDEPASLHFKGITLTPGGFTAAETSWRSKALSADVNTPFNSAPMPGSSNSNISEFNFTGRQSRISMLMEGKVSNAKIGGYYEGDFLGGGSTSNNNQSNSYVFRQRQFWGQAAFDNGWTITGGQQWSLITQTAKGMDNRTEYLPMTIDAQYHIGFSWARQYGMRFTKNFDNKFWLGFSVEAPQTTFTVHGNPTTTVTSGQTTVLVPCATGVTGPCTANVGGTSTTYTNFLLGAAGAGGGLFNPLANYSYNPSPDLVFKAVAEPGFGHYEVFAVYTRYRDRVFPCIGGTAGDACTSNAAVNYPSATGAFNDSRNGGGVGANALWNLFDKHLDFGIHFMGGNGIGRYGSGGLADATIRPDGTIALLKNYMALGTIVLHPTPKLDLYLNGGGEYASRAAYLNGTKGEGYGSPLFSNAGCYTEVGPTTSTPAGTAAGSGYIPGGLSNCTADTRNLLEGTFGFWYRFYSGSRGKVQYGMQYSYYVRNTWAGAAPTSGPGTGVATPSGVENMWFTSFRYYLP